MSYSIRQNPSPFFTAGRPYGILGLALHHAATTDFNGIGYTFKTAGVSAGYGVGRNKNVDQYVADGNIAYHAGDWGANQKYIGIEHLNSSGAPNWDIDDVTFNTSVELARDLVARHKLGRLVPFQNLFPHDYFTATYCPGKLRALLKKYADAVNKEAGKASGGASAARRSNDAIATEVLNGKWGNNPQRTAALKKAGYNPDTIQGVVNARLTGKATAPKKSVSKIARQVIAGSFGNGPARAANLKRAGYDPAKVQAEVNKQLGFGKTVPKAGGIIAVGQTVAFTRAVDYNGNQLGVSGTYKVMEVRGDRVVVGRGGAVTAAVKKSNLRKV